MFGAALQWSGFSGGDSAGLVLPAATMVTQVVALADETIPQPFHCDVQHFIHQSNILNLYTHLKEKKGVKINIFWSF